MRPSVRATVRECGRFRVWARRGFAGQRVPALCRTSPLDPAGAVRGRAPRMRMRGLEPPRPYGHTDLNRARLPIPPHPRGLTILARVAGTREQVAGLLLGVAEL